MRNSSVVFAGTLFVGTVLATIIGVVAPARAQTVMQQCGQQYQAAKTAGTLNGMTWNQFRVECATRLKATPASTAPATAPAPMAPTAPAAPVPPVTNPLKPTPTTTAAAPAPSAPVAPPMTASKTGAPVSPGRAAMLTRERQCGAEWRTQKVALVAQTPGLTWPRYWSQCNTRLKAAGQ